MITCLIRYTLDQNKVADFEQYARAWMRLIEKYGGTHHGYYLPHDSPPAASFSFSDIGSEGPADFAIALFSFPTIEAYEKYRRDVAADDECVAETIHHKETQRFTKVQGSVLKTG